MIGRGGHDLSDSHQKIGFPQPYASLGPVKRALAKRPDDVAGEGIIDHDSVFRRGTGAAGAFRSDPSRGTNLASGMPESSIAFCRSVSRCLAANVAGPSRRTPGASPFVNSTPAVSRAVRMAARVRGFRISPRSRRATVSGETDAAAAKSRTPHPTAARAIFD